MNETSKNDTPINMASMASILAPNVAQYLHPDYLQPLPTTLDAKKSPLALLAQTCSSIGKDPTPSKSIIPPLEKETKDADKPSEKTVSSDNRKSPSNDSGNESGRESSKKSSSSFKSAPPKEIPPLVPISSAATRKSSPAPAHGHSEKSSETTTVTNSVTRPVASTGSSKDGSSGYRSTNSVSNERDRESDRERERDRERNRSRDNSSAGNKPSNRSSPDHLSSSNKHHSHAHPSLNGFGVGMHHPGLSLYGSGLGFDPASMGSAYASTLAAAHSGYNLSASAAAALAAQNAALSKSGYTPGLSPYVSYARVRTPSGATTLVPVCRDPYCTNCQLTIQNSHVSSTCTAPGCSQCAHEKSLQSLCALGMAGVSSLSMLPQFSLANSLSSLPPGLSSYPGLSSSLYAHSFLGSTPAHSQGTPYVCNWVSGTDYCGKRYSTSEELLQHLRTHTSSSEAASSLASYAALGLPPPLGLPGFPHAPLPAHGGLSPNSLRRAYPNIPSPLGNVLNGSRYHPYKSPLPSVPSGLTPGQSLSSLGPYYSPYSLYSQRIGAAAVP
ncbi:zinc finger protein Noc-like [Dreissena polymorpha]|uniref:C2H2-type domain-containing protein n=1 Tax=Dreissena polymorpha TaxID=45954 RepID=A0A9D4LPR8_DREPO|nr:zinc finger protein Noc-like [Dreissena polymorpha]KAH3861522.1 hypothetical protein DPMN_024454 [Dreissena polymorpha]